ncbi:phage portal protein [Heyndrickxia shackletonii]|uniref:phage portal protein n=1 Tax=Heyndrickxia shackletonii TaxID=157838 RepID=UPI0006EC1549|nr:phage portal protein [Heyndrickxia shackletonii]NEY99249.1 phage portal protein [Heyndrickxia shackletonii]
MGLRQKWRELRYFKKQEQRDSMTLEELLLSAGIPLNDITKEQALTIPAVSAASGLISDIIASLPIHLYKEENGKVIEVKNDPRVSMLNDDTKDTLNGFQFKKALIEDYLLNGAGYAYINRQRNNVKSLNYVEYKDISVNVGVDPIFKSYDILVNGQTYRDFEFLKIARNSKDGVTGKGIIHENNKMLSVAYYSLIFEEVLVKTGGNKKGFLTSESKLTDEVIAALKRSWNDLYKNNSENVMILNKGLDFKESSNTSVEMQLNENKKTNSAEILKLFLVFPSILDGSASDDVYNEWIKICISPKLTEIETCLNKDLLLPSEQDSFYFAIDSKELLKGDMEKRYKAYEIALKNKILDINEVRYLEDREPIKAFEDIVVLGLNDVLYNIKTGAVYTPNTDKSTNMNNPDTTLGGGDDNANRDSRGSGTT